jgi:ligand-binding SRPBCC domain-containing protein
VLNFRNLTLFSAAGYHAWMPVYDYSITVAAPLEPVRDFQRDSTDLRRLTPPPTIVQLHSIEPLAEGSISEFTLWVGPLPLRWRAVHRDVSERGFTDVQASGPAARWEHTHSFVPLADGRTEIREHIEYEHARGFWGLVTRVLFSWPSLWFMFGYRRWVTRRALERR